MFVGPDGASVQAGAGIVADAIRRRGPRVPQQGGGAARRRPRRPPHDRRQWLTCSGSRCRRDFVRVSGADAASFLQGQISQDIEAVRTRGSAWSFLLQPQGKVDAWLRVSSPGNDEFVLDVDGGFGEAVIARLNRFKLRVKVDIDAARAGGAWRFGATALPHVAGLAAEWPGIEGVDVRRPRSQTVHAGPSWHPRGLRAARIEAGVPAMGREITTATIPAETRCVTGRSVSFTKGCYTGQELVARIDSRGGNVPRHLRLLRVDGEARSGPRSSTTAERSGRSPVRRTTTRGRSPCGACSVRRTPRLRGGGRGRGTRLSARCFALPH